MLTGLLQPTSATPREDGDSTSGRHNSKDNNGGHADDVTRVVTGVNASSFWEVDVALTTETPLS